MPAATARILEIGDYDFVRLAYPDRTTLLWTGWRDPLSYGTSAFDCTPARFLHAVRDLHAGRYDLVVVHLSARSSWLPRYWVRSLARQPWKPVAAVMRCTGTSWLRAIDVPVPLVAVDLHDHFGIGRHNFFLLDKADVVFKRELLADRWQVLSYTAHPALPTLRIRSNARWQRRMEKLKPIALPVPAIDTGGLWDGDFPEKMADVFFSGNTQANSWVRRTGMAELQTLAARGIKVDIVEQRLPQAEFFRRMSRAWLAWSPSGLGWECYRAAEAAQCLAVPVINHATIERHRPLRDGEHMIAYDIEPGGLTQAIEAALADKERLKRMAQAARQHALAHHVPTALVDHVIEAGLSLRKPRG
jgi:hypothetical protein